MSEKHDMVVIVRMHTSSEPGRSNAAIQPQQGSQTFLASSHNSEIALHEPHALNTRGLDALVAGDPAGARTHFEAAIALDPNADSLWLNLATCCRELGDDEGEARSLEQVLRLNRTSLAGWIRLAELHQRIGNDEEALKAWRNAFEIHSGSGQSNQAICNSLEQGAKFLAEQAVKFEVLLVAELDENVSPAKDDRSVSWRLRAGIDAMLGKRRIFQNVCAGFHFPFLPSEEFFDRSQFPWLERVEQAADAIRQEFLALADPGAAEFFRPYVNLEPGTPHNIWTALDGSSNWSSAFLWEYGAANSKVLDRCPMTRRLLESLPLAVIPGRGPSAFFSVLEAGATIPPHTGVTNIRAIVHLPLIVPDGCWFRVGGERREWIEGKALVFDDTIEHEAANPTSRSRAVLIFDVWNPWLSDVERCGLQATFSAISGKKVK